MTTKTIEEIREELKMLANFGGKMPILTNLGRNPYLTINAAIDELAELRRQKQIADSLPPLNEVMLRATTAAAENACAEEREACARICADMVIGGRAWTHDQEVAAAALYQATKAIRERK